MTMTDLPASSMMCDNGRPGLTREQCHVWQVPGTAPARPLIVAPGPEGFLLTHLAMFVHDRVERLDTGQLDDWSYAFRPIRGTTGTLSNHAGWAMDLNATRHPLGVATDRTFTTEQQRRIRARLKWMRVIRWGGDYVNRPDAMHFEIVGSPAACRAVAAMLKLTPRGRAVRKLNPGGWK